MEKEIKYSTIDLIGVELFRKNNDTFISSKLSPVMERIFLAANKYYGIKDIEDEYYMKSGIIPNRVYYIYSNRIDPKSIFDIVTFNGELCIWFYSKNAIDMIDRDPIGAILKIYNSLLKVFKKCILNTFTSNENHLVKYVMTIRLLHFLNETYGIIDMVKCKYLLANNYMTQYTPESVIAFIDDVLDNYNNKTYFTNREYLDSYLLLVDLE